MRLSSQMHDDDQGDQRCVRFHPGSFGVGEEPASFAGRAEGAALWTSGHHHHHHLHDYEMNITNITVNIIIIIKTI